MPGRTSTIRLSPERRASIDDVRHATVSRQAWVDTAIDRALEAALAGSGTPEEAPGVSSRLSSTTPPRAHTEPPIPASAPVEDLSDSPELCRTCRVYGSPGDQRTGYKPCPSCGHTGPKPTQENTP